MIFCKFCKKNFKSPADFLRHLHSKSCDSPSSRKNVKNANKSVILSKKNEQKNDKNLVLETCFECKYCNKKYKHKSSHSRHIKNCFDKKALEFFLGDKLEKMNMSLDEFIKYRDEKTDAKNPQIINNIMNLNNFQQNNNFQNNNNFQQNNNFQTNNNYQTNNILKNNNIIMINPFGKENIEHILNNKELCLDILNKTDNGVNKLFLEVYNKNENRNFYKVDKSKNKIATLNNNHRIKHNDYKYISELIFSRMHNLYNKISENLKDICDDKIKRCINKNLNHFNKSGTKSSNKITLDNYLDYMSKINEKLITKMLIENGIIDKDEIPMLDV